MDEEGEGEDLPMEKEVFPEDEDDGEGEDDDMELLDDGNPEDAHKQKQKRKAHAKKKRSIEHWLHKSGKCLLCTYKQEDLRVDALICHWQAKHFTQLKAAQAAQDNGKDLSAAIGAVDSPWAAFSVLSKRSLGFSWGAG